MDMRDWWDLYNRLVDWQIKFDEFKDTGLGTILGGQIQTCNREFALFVESHYQDWIQSEKRPPMCPDVVTQFVKQCLDQNEKVCLIVVDCMRHDQFKSLMPIFQTMFNVHVDYKLSLLPTATPYSRNAIFCGLFPDEMVKKYPEQARLMVEHASSLN